MTTPKYEYEPANAVADAWAKWSGKDCRWVKALREFGDLGGIVKWYCGYPRSASAIPLCFSLATADGEELPCGSRLKDIRMAAARLRLHSAGTISDAVDSGELEKPAAFPDDETAK